MYTVKSLIIGGGVCGVGGGVCGRGGRISAGQGDGGVGNERVNRPKTKKCVTEDQTIFQNWTSEGRMVGIGGGGGDY